MSQEVIRVSIATSVTVQHDEVLAALNRHATQAKQAGNWDLAVVLLRQAKARQGNLHQDTRLAKFLQQAGRLDEALQEIQWLLDHSASWAKTTFAHQPVSVVLAAQTEWRARVCREADLICKRAKRPELQAQFERCGATYAALAEKLRTVTDAEREIRVKEWEEARKAGGKVLRDLLSKRAAETEKNRQRNQERNTL